MTGRRLPAWAFVDTSAFFGLQDPLDQYHAPAVDIQTRLVAERYRLVTTNFVLAETHALLLSRVGRAEALRFLDGMRDSRIVTERVSPGDERDAHSLIRQYDDKDFSFTDATSFRVMARLRISEAFTFDRNFEQYGLTMLRTR